jgi:hypothetical protein
VIQQIAFQSSFAEFFVGLAFANSAGLQSVLWREWASTSGQQQTNPQA